MDTILAKPTLKSLQTRIDPEFVATLVNTEFGVLGRTASTASHPNTSGSFYFWLSRDAVEARAIDIGSIVVALADDKRELVFAAVNELNSVSGSDSIVQDYYDHNEGDTSDVKRPQQVEVVVATCAVVRTLSSKTRPVTRSMVYFPTALGIQFAFGIVDAKGESAYAGVPIPVGIYENGDGTIAPVCIDENYLVGPEAAHMNVSGISGLACKTSALEFCLKSLLSHTSKRVGVVVINVKSNDLLYLDQVNTRLLNDPWSAHVYDSLGIPIEGFTTARFFAPSSPRSRAQTQSLRELPTEPFRWDLGMLYQELPSLFNQADWDNNTEGAWYVVKSEIERGNIESYEGMLTWIDKLLSTSGLTEWPRGFPTATWHKLKSDLRRFTVQYRGLIAEDSEGIEIAWEDLRRGQIFAIDIQMLSEGGQKLVFGHCIRQITNLLETRSTRLDSVVVFVDELNKFAPKDGNTPLKSSLIEVTARGRSLGLILFGAEQFASAVEKQIVENSSTFIFGRTESTEMETANYAGLTNEMKAKLRMLPQGQLLVKFPKFPQPIFVRFPYPPCLPGEDFRLSADDTAERVRMVREARQPAGSEANGESAANGMSIDSAYPAASVGATVGTDASRHEKGSWLRRYQAGECEAVWAEMVALGDSIRDMKYFDDAGAVARETMQRARQNIEILIKRLDEMGYEFYTRPDVVGRDASRTSSTAALGAMRQMLQGLAGKSADHLRDRNVYQPASGRESTAMGRLERRGLTLPLSLKAWMEEVGRVDFTGSHPALCALHEGGFGVRAVLSVVGADARTAEFVLAKPINIIGRANIIGNDIPLSGDTLVSKQHARIERDRENNFAVIDNDSTNGLRVNNIKIDKRRTLKNGDEIIIGATHMVFSLTKQEDTRPLAGIFADPLVIMPTTESVIMRLDRLKITRLDAPYNLFISPYDADKSVPDTTGEQIEDGYTMVVPCKGADSMLVGERHNINFVEYLRLAFRWGGFPGWDRYKNPPVKEISYLTGGLLPL